MDGRVNDLLNEKLCLEKKHSFYQERIDSLEMELKMAKNQLSNNSGGKDGALLPE